MKGRKILISGHLKSYFNSIFDQKANEIKFEFFLGCRYDKIAETIHNAKGSGFRVNWKKFARKINTHKDDILLLEQKVNSEGMEDIIIILLEKWCDKEEVVTLSKLTQILQELELNSTAKALQDVFNALMVNKTPESPNSVSSSKGIVYKRATKTVFRTKKSKPIHMAKHLFKPLIRNNVNEDEITHQITSGIDPSLADEYQKRCATDWLKKRNYKMGLTAVSILVVCILVIGIYLASSLTHLQVDTEKESKTTSKNITHYINASTYQEYEKAVSEIEPVGNFSINITSLNATSWPKNPKLSHSGYMKNMVVSNITNYGLLYHILHQTNNLDGLHIIHSPSSNCSDNDSWTIFRKRVVYSNIISITFSNFRSCKPVYEFFSTFFVARKLLTLSLVRSEIDDANIDEIQSIMQNSAKILLNLSFSGNIANSKHLFSFKPPLLHVQQVKLNIVQRKLLLVSLYDHNIAGDLFCETLKNLHTFENTVGINLLDFIYVLKCAQLKNLTAHVIVPSNGPFLNISSALKGNYLEYVNLSMRFDLPCPSSKNIKLLGILSLKKRILVKSSIECINCPCTNKSSAGSNNERTSYVLDQRHHSSK